MSYVVLLSPLAGLCTILSGILTWKLLEDQDRFSKGLIAGTLTMILISIMPAIILSAFAFQDGLNLINVFYEAISGLLYSILILGGATFLAVYGITAEILKRRFKR